MRNYYFLPFIIFLVACGDINFSGETIQTEAPKLATINQTSLVILGTIQDAGSPQIGCEKKCCTGLFNHPDDQRQVVSLGLIDATNKKSYLFEATPDIGRQLSSLSDLAGNNQDIADGIFLTHAHIGHYTGLMYLGKEAMNAKSVPVFSMPRMKEFLTNNGPWSQLVLQENIKLNELTPEKTIQLSASIQVTPILVPHRDEYSETVGYRINGPNKAALFIPDIDKWEKWEKDILEEIRKVDYAFLDATFFSGKEINNRDISEIPHPFIIESLEKFKGLSSVDKGKIIFIHFNHTNPVIDPSSLEAKQVVQAGFKIGQINEIFPL